MIYRICHRNTPDSKVNHDGSNQKNYLSPGSKKNIHIKADSTLQSMINAGEFPRVFALVYAVADGMRMMCWPGERTRTGSTRNGCLTGITDMTTRKKRPRYGAAFLNN